MQNRLWNRGFVGLGVVQFLGAANDNILKYVMTMMVVKDGIWEGKLGSGPQGLIFLLFVIPFLAFSAVAGMINDRYSKSTVTFWVKVAEVPIAILAGIGFWVGNLWITLGALLLLTTQSTFFGPAKYGMIPELVGEEKLSKANGLISMTTNIAVILGTLGGGFVSYAYCSFTPESGPVIEAPYMPLVALTAVAVVGVLGALLLPKLPVGDADALEEEGVGNILNPFAAYYQASKEMSRSNLLLVVITWAFFYFFAGLAMLIIPEYKEVLGIDDKQVSYLFAGLGLTIGLGSGAAGYLSGNRIEPRLIPLGAAGLCISFLLLGVIPPNFTNVLVFIGLAGFFAGFYLVPLLALIQKLSPPDERGRFIATSNAYSFSFLAAASGLYMLIRAPFGDHPEKIFLLAAVLLLVGAGVLLFGLRGLVVLRQNREANEAR